MKRKDSTVQTTVNREYDLLKVHPQVVEVKGPNGLALSVAQHVDLVDAKRDRYRLNGLVHVYGSIGSGEAKLAIADDSTCTADELIEFATALLQAAGLGVAKRWFPRRSSVERKQKAS